MNVFEENELLRKELEAVRADLAAAETRLQQLHVTRMELTDEEARQILTRRLRVPDDGHPHWAVTRDSRTEARHGIRRR
jgi:hypothetical protein